MNECMLSQVVLRDGKAIDAEVPDYSELDTVPSQQQYADHAPEVPSAVPWIASQTALNPEGAEDAPVTDKKFLTQMASKMSEAQKAEVRNSYNCTYDRSQNHGVEFICMSSRPLLRSFSNDSKWVQFSNTI